MNPGPWLGYTLHNHMPKRFLQWTLASALLAGGLYLFLTFRPAPPKTAVSDFTNKVHSELYAGAQGLWDAQLTTSAFRPQTFQDRPITSASGSRVSWTQPEVPFNHFVLTITQPESQWSRSDQREHDGLALDLTDLLPNTKYVVDLQACVDPACETWYIASEEVTFRTERLLFQFTREPIDTQAPSIVTHEKMSDQLSRDGMTFYDPDGNEFSDEEKNRLTFGAVFIDRTANQFYVLVYQGDGVRYARMINP